jgi:hypothetical protein
LNALVGPERAFEDEVQRIWAQFQIGAIDLEERKRQLVELKSKTLGLTDAIKKEIMLRHVPQLKVPSKFHRGY